jgi:hypothetical protein
LSNRSNAAGGLSTCSLVPLASVRISGTHRAFWHAGDTFGAAISDFADTVAELYLHLSDTEALSEDLIVVRDTLARYIAVRQQ